METLHRSLAQSGLVRTRENQLIGGVCSGLAKRFGADPWAMRALVFIAMVIVPGSPLILYPVAWVLMPDEEQAATALGRLSRPAESYQTPDVHQAPQQAQYPQKAQYPQA